MTVRAIRKLLQDNAKDQDARVMVIVRIPPGAKDNALFMVEVVGGIEDADTVPGVVGLLTVGTRAEEIDVPFEVVIR